MNDIIKFEKANMNKIRRIVNYLIVPLYVLITLICLAIIGVLMEIDESRNTPAAIGLFIFIGVMTVILLASVPLIRKAEIKAELKRYVFNSSSVESRDIYDFSDEKTAFRLDRSGMYVNDAFYWYNHLKIHLNTSNYLNRIWITVMFFVNESDYCEILLNTDTINMIERFNINLVNREVFDYIINNKEKAFEKIYKTGHI